MVTDVRYFATESDEQALLDFMGEPSEVVLHPWPLLREPLERLSRIEALRSERVMVTNRSLGGPVRMFANSPALQESSRSGLFNRITWNRLRPDSGEALVDANTSPVLLWSPVRNSTEVLHAGSIGSQAESLAKVSGDYEQWVRRVQGWVRRKGTSVWGLAGAAVRPDLDIDLAHVSAVYALPGALDCLTSGASARARP